MPPFALPRRLAAEFIGTAFLLATVTGSSIMAESLAGGNVAIGLMRNTIATGTILVVLIFVFSQVSGAHFNPAVSLAFALRKGMPARDVWVPYSQLLFARGSLPSTIEKTAAFPPRPLLNP